MTDKDDGLEIESLTERLGGAYMTDGESWSKIERVVLSDGELVFDTRPTKRYDVPDHLVEDADENRDDGKRVIVGADLEGLPV